MRVILGLGLGFIGLQRVPFTTPVFLSNEAEFAGDKFPSKLGTLGL